MLAPMKPPKVQNEVNRSQVKTVCLSQKHGNTPETPMVFAFLVLVQERKANIRHR